MGLEKQVKNTAILQVSPVERTIEKVEGSKLRIQRVEDNQSINIEDYKEQVEEKLPKILNIIDMLGFEIIKLSEYGTEISQKDLRVLFKDYSYKIEKGFGLCQRDGGKIYSGMFMYVNKGRRGDYHFYIVFDKSSESIAQISLYNDGGQGVIVSSKEEFVREYVNSIEMFRNQASWKKGPIRLPFICTKIPDLIVKEYETVYGKKKRELDGINNLNKEMVSLKVSDIL